MSVNLHAEEIERVPLLGAAPLPPLTIAQALRLALAAGFRGAGACTIVAIAIAESELIPNARYLNRSRVTGQVLSTDRGILQENDKAWPHISDAQADDPANAFRLAFDPISNRGEKYTPWSTFNAGKHLPHIAAVQKALLRIQQPSVPHLDRPFHGAVIVTQPFGPTSFTFEPPGNVYPDGSIAYYQSGAGSYIAPHVHGGVDWSLNYATILYAPADGTVAHAGRDDLGPGGTDSGFGLSLRIKHAQVTTLYGHLSALKVTPGQTVKRGQVVALSGGASQFPGDWRQGNSTGAHLHFSVCRNSDGHYVDPAPYIFAPDVSPPAPQKIVKPDGLRHVTFSAKQRESSGIYDGPSSRLHKLGEQQPGAMLHFDAVAKGEPKHDKSINQMDDRWFHLADRSGWIASAHVAGNPPPA